MTLLSAVLNLGILVQYLSVKDVQPDNQPHQLQEIPRNKSAETYLLPFQTAESDFMCSEKSPPCIHLQLLQHSLAKVTLR